MQKINATSKFYIRGGEIRLILGRFGPNASAAPIVARCGDWVWYGDAFNVAPPDQHELLAGKVWAKYAPDFGITPNGDEDDKIEIDTPENNWFAPSDETWERAEALFREGKPRAAVNLLHAGAVWWDIESGLTWLYKQIIQEEMAGMTPAQQRFAQVRLHQFGASYYSFETKLSILESARASA